MPASRNRLSRFLADSRPQCDPVFHSVSNFYREEFVKCKRCLEQQREYYSAGAVADVEKALTQVMAQLDRLCTEGDADQVVSRLLRQFDVVTGLSAWSDPRQIH
jgi:methylphosphotriester-DNA--protein-cysteine methyltransferase